MERAIAYAFILEGIARHAVAASARLSRVLKRKLPLRAHWLNPDDELALYAAILSRPFRRPELLSQLYLCGVALLASRPGDIFAGLSMLKGRTSCEVDPVLRHLPLFGDLFAV